MEKKLNIFQINSPAVSKFYKEDNYRIEYAEESNLVEKDLCVCYFSSHEIYYPNTLESFNYSIVEKDKYEWMNNKFINAQKHIFIRDIHKQWYFTGINENLNTPDKLLEFLKSETEGYRVQAVGSSAGGYAALLFGNLLKCERVYAFNAQFNLHKVLLKSNFTNDPILFEKKDAKEWAAYYDLSNFLTNKSNNYYFQSCYSKIDFSQYISISEDAKKNLKIIRFKTSNHGFPFLRINLKKLLLFTDDDLEKLVNKTFHPILFSFQLIGVTSTSLFVLKSLKDRFMKKRREYIMKNKS